MWRSGAFFTVWIMSWFWLTIIWHAAVMFGKTPDYVALHVIFYIIAAVAVVSFWVASLSDPGYIPRAVAPTNAELMYVDAAWRIFLLPPHSIMGSCLSGVAVPGWRSRRLHPEQMESPDQERCCSMCSWTTVCAVSGLMSLSCTCRRCLCLISCRSQDRASRQRSYAGELQCGDWSRKGRV